MEKPMPSINLHLFSSSCLKSGYRYGDKVKELCGSIVSQVFFQALFLIFIFQFGLVGGTIGAIAGALIGFKNKMNLIQDVIMGAVSGVVLSQKVIRATFDHFVLSEDDNELGCFLHVIEIIAGDLESKLIRDKDHIFIISKVASCERLIKLPKIQISNHHAFDPSGNASCCSICLQDFEVGNVAGSFPICEHKFHSECISKWLFTHSSCPVCRRSI